MCSLLTWYNNKINRTFIDSMDFGLNPLYEKTPSAKLTWSQECQKSENSVGQWVEDWCYISVRESVEGVGRERGF